MSESWLIPAQFIVDSEGEVKLLAKGDGESLYILYLGKSHEKNSHMQIFSVSYRTFDEKTGYYFRYSIAEKTKHYRVTQDGKVKISLYRLLYLIATESGIIKSPERFSRHKSFKWDAEIIIETHSGGKCAWLYVYPNKNNKNIAFSIVLHLLGSYQYFDKHYLYEEYRDENCACSSQDSVYCYLNRLRYNIKPIPSNQSVETILKYN